MDYLDIYCVSCKKVIPNNASFCPYCGSDQRNPGRLPGIQSSNTIPLLLKSNGIGKNRKWHISIVVFILISILIVIEWKQLNATPQTAHQRLAANDKFIPAPNTHLSMQPTSNLQPTQNQFPSTQPLPGIQPSTTIPTQAVGAAPSPDISSPGTNSPDNALPSAPLDLNVPSPEIGTVKITDATINFVEVDDMNIMAAGRVTITNTTDRTVMSVKLILGSSFGPELVPFEGSVDDPMPIYDTSIASNSTMSFPVMTTGSFSDSVYGPHTISLEADMDNGDVLTDSTTLF